MESFYLGNGQGLVGAISAIGYEFFDHTFELLCYRKKSQFGKKRIISKHSVKKMQSITLNQKGMKLNALSGSVHNERIIKLHCCLLALRIDRHSIRACDYLTTNHLTAPF